MPLAGDPHVEVSRVDDARRPAGLVGDQGRQQGGMGGLRLLAAEPAAHPRARADDHVLPEPETMGHHGLDLARVLGRGMDGHLPPSPGMARAAWVSR